MFHYFITFQILYHGSLLFVFFRLLTESYVVNDKTQMKCVYVVVFGNFIYYAVPVCTCFV